MSKYFAAMILLGLSSFASAQELNAEKLDGLRFELLRGEQPRLALASTASRITVKESFAFNAASKVEAPFEFLTRDADADLQARAPETLELRPSDRFNQRTQVLVVAPQDGDAELKTRILEKVRTKLSADRAALLKRIEKIIDDELGKPAPTVKPAPGPGPGPKAEPEGDAKVKDLERKLRLLEEQKETLASEMAKAKRQAADEALREEARKDGPHDAEEAQEMFDNALELHDKDKNYREAIKLFKRIYYNFPKTRVGSISAYNAACGYALAGSKEEAIDWLEYSVKAGYNDFDHLRKDTDLDGLRNEKRYKKLLTDR